MSWLGFDDAWVLWLLPLALPLALVGLHVAQVALVAQVAAVAVHAVVHHAVVGERRQRGGAKHDERRTGQAGPGHAFLHGPHCRRSARRRAAIV